MLVAVCLQSYVENMGRENETSIVDFVLLGLFLGTSVVHLNSFKARNKALAMCSSHLMVVFLYFGPTMFIYMIPSSLHTAEQDEGLSVFYTILTPMMNPLIYSLRNREVGEALRKILGKA
ncbi:Olfactory receptor 2M4 [Manis javanica]|nr:Olfactory receptor 2M4 [Manis javanica]